MVKLGLDTVVDGKVSSYDVREGRPAPYMIFKMMHDLDSSDVRRVAKVGDTVRDIQEGRNAGAFLLPLPLPFPLPLPLPLLLLLRL